MTLSDDVKARLEQDVDLATLLTGGIHNGVEEISRQNTPTAFDATTLEILPCALIKLGTEIPLRGFTTSVQTPITIYFYQRAGYDVIEPAIGYVFADLNQQKIGASVWNIEFDNVVYQQRDQALDCALGTLRFVAKRLR